MKKKEKNIILFVGRISEKSARAIRDYEKRHKVKFRLASLVSTKNKDNPTVIEWADIVIPCDMENPTHIQRALLSFEEELLAVTCHSDSRILNLQRVIPNVPYLRTPTAESLKWSTDKIMMRKRFSVYDKKITPAFTIVHDATKTSVKKIKERVGFPVIVKPAGLAASALVSINYHQEELEKTLKTLFRKINNIYKEKGRGGVEPRVLVEQFMEGEQYSVDAYITSRGRVYFCPFVHVKTGKAIGFDDFFGYLQTTPVSLNKQNKEDGELVAKKAVYALGLRNTTVHIELMKTERGWKIIELGPRMGGFRENIYRLSYGINHTINDVLVRIPQKPIIPKKVKGYSAAMKFYAPKEGILENISGLRKIEKLESFELIRQLRKLGDRCKFAKHGGTAVVSVILFNKDRSKLLADIRRVEQTLVIKTAK